MMKNIEPILQDIQQGKMIIVVDDDHRENEGDIFFPAQMIEPSIVNFLITKARGLVCVAMEKDRLEKLKIPLMVKDNEDLHQTKFTVSVDFKKSTTGISAFERAETIKALAFSEDPNDFRRPGHMFPLQSEEGGLVKRRGHTEAATTLMKLAGLIPCCVICEIINEDGTMARMNDLKIFSEQYKIKICSIEDLVNYIQEKKFSF